MRHRSRLFDLIVLKSWWMILIMLGCLMVFDLEMRHRREDYNQLQMKCSAMHAQLSSEIERQEWLSQEVNSHSDPRWIELILMRNLGLIPEGETKIVFLTP